MEGILKENTGFWRHPLPPENLKIRFGWKPDASYQKGAQYLYVFVCNLYISEQGDHRVSAKHQLFRCIRGRKAITRVLMCRVHASMVFMKYIDMVLIAIVL